MQKIRVACVACLAGIVGVSVGSAQAALLHDEFNVFLDVGSYHISGSVTFDGVAENIAPGTTVNESILIDLSGDETVSIWLSSLLKKSRG